jgi:hypothetical protein
MYNQTNLNPIAFAFTIIMCLAILKVRREYMIIPLILVACFITNMQRISLAGVDFSMLRIITMVGLFRIIIRDDKMSMKFNSIDKILIYYSIIKVLSFTILWSNANAFIYMLGQILDTIGAYFLIRFAIYDFKEYDIIIKTMIISAIFVSVFMVLEHLSGGRNIFSVFGGVPEMSEVRNGRLRAQGAFGHSIMAGTFGAALLPLSWGLWQRKFKKTAVIGIIASIVITFASSSSGPIMSLLFGIFGICFWFLNRYTAIIRNMFFVSLVLLHLVMKAPIWHLIARIDIVGGSTGYHRYLLMDAAIHNFFGWFLFGIRDTGVWGRGLQDITNQYILEGANGGIITMILFIVVIIKCFSTVGFARAKVIDQPDAQMFIWSLGVVLFAHTINFISVSYFEQLVFIFYLLLAMISSLNNLPEVTGENRT